MFDQDQDQDQGRLPGGRLFRLRRVTWKSTPSNQGCLLLVWPFLRQGSFTPVPLRGPAAIRHPWRGAALAASMPLGPLRETCVQPAPKSRLAVAGLLRRRSTATATATASRLKPVPLLCWSLWLKPVPLLRWSRWLNASFCRSRLAGESIYPAAIYIPDPPRSPASRLLQGGCVHPV
jgi:hypothetical protein